ncbi:MAG: hypothetical protein HQL67_00170 [Magnetococcales bacterium]|nr:hypothetical protein [Magnetococcales bacterium]
MIIYRLTVFFALLMLSSLIARPANAENQQSKPAQQSLAFLTYQSFSTAFMTGDFKTALNLSIGPAQETVLKRQALVKSGDQPIIPILDPLYIKVSETAKEDGTVAIHSLQVLQHDGEKGMFLPPDLHRQFITLSNQDTEWKVIKFRDDKEKCCIP